MVDAGGGVGVIEGEGGGVIGVFGDVGDDTGGASGGVGGLSEEYFVADPERGEGVEGSGGEGGWGC